MFSVRRIVPLVTVLARNRGVSTGLITRNATQPTPCLFQYSQKFQFGDDTKNKRSTRADGGVEENVGAPTVASTTAASEEKEGENTTGPTADGEPADDKSKASGTEEPTAAESIKLPSFSFSKMMDFSKDTYASLVDNVRVAYAELKGEDRHKILKRKVEQAASFRAAKKKSDDDEDEDEDETPKEKGPSALVWVKEPVGAWEAMKNRLQDSPLIREILKGTRKVSKVAADTPVGKQAQDAVRGVQDKIHDAREFWETSQNPLVYTLSGVWDNIAGETEEGMTTAAIRKLDPHFDKEEWADVVKQELAPAVIGAHLRGDAKALKPLCGEAVYSKLAADIRARKSDGISFDTNILDIDENQIVMKLLDDKAPIIVVVYMVQQINCIRNKKGEIIEVSE